ncbi:MAG: hypothetical protein AAF709_03960 [Pseudomonadota bacterium]
MRKSLGPEMTRRQLLRYAKRIGLLSTASATLPLLTAPSQATERGLLPIGMNLSGISDFGPGFPFLNLMWGARPWLTRSARGEGPWSTGLTQHLEMDENGYPLEVPFRAPGVAQAQTVFTIVPNTLKRGRYVLLYDGEGKISTNSVTRILDSRPGRIEIFMAHRSDDDVVEVLEIRESQRGNHIRNMRLLAIEHEHADLTQNPFRQETLDYCKQWHCLRFMDWLGTNGSLNQSWEKRQRPDFYTQVGRSGDLIGIHNDAMPEWEARWSSGVAIELCIQLANAVKRDAWFCVPHLADDTYIKKMAELVRDRLDPSLKVYVEFSNEIWNWQFVQSHWMLRSALAGKLVTEQGGPPPWEGGVTPQRFRNGIAIDVGGDLHPERTGALFRRCFRIWESVFKGENRKRLVRVCAVQNGWHDTARRTLDWVMKNGGCDALSPGGYFGPDEEIYRDWEARGASLTAEKVLSDMQRSIAVNAEQLKVYADTAKQAGVELVIYEGGQHIQPLHQQETPYNAALADAQKQPEMYQRYIEHLKHYANSGCTMFCAYSSVSKQGSRYGSWGHLERYDQPPSEMPKQRALLDANKKL